MAALTQSSAALLEATLKDVLDEGQARGNIRRGIDTRAAARFIAARPALAICAPWLAITGDHCILGKHAVKRVTSFVLGVEHVDGA